MAVRCGSGGMCTVGAEFAAAVGTSGVRGYYYEVEVLAGGKLFVGFAGTNLGPQCITVGKDACSWSCENDGYVWHRCVWEGGVRALRLREAVWWCWWWRRSVACA